MEKEKAIVNFSEKKKVESNNVSTCEFKSARQLHYEKRQKSTCTKAFNIQISQNSEKCVANEALPLNQDIASPHSSADDAETDYFSDGDVSATPSNYLQNCIQQMTESNLVKSVLRKCEKKGLTRHFMALMEGLANGKLSVTNMPFLLALEFALLQSLENSTQMRYREDMTLFWEIALSVGGPRLLRLFASDKHFGQVNSGKSKQSKYSPKDGSYIFAVPDERILRKSKTNIPKDISCGVIDEAVNLLVPEKEYILSLDGKQVGQGLKDNGIGDVDLWGFEGPPSLKDTLRYLRNECNNILLMSDKIQAQERDDVLDNDIIKDLKFVVQTLSFRIKSLRESKVRHEMLRNTFTNKIKKFPDQGSRYQIAFSDIEAFLARADILIKDILSLNWKWCNIMACINRNTQCFLGTGTVDLEKQKNFRILLKPQTIELSNPGFLNDNPEYVKQKTVEWFNKRRWSRITASTMHNALGLRTLKAQKDLQTRIQHWYLCME